MSNLPQEVQDHLESMKTVKTFPHVLSQTAEEIRETTQILYFIVKNLKQIDPETSATLNIDTFASILRNQALVLDERADLLFEILND